jgi:hypothetical protein
MRLLLIPALCAIFVVTNLPQAEARRGFGGFHAGGFRAGGFRTVRAGEFRGVRGVRGATWRGGRGWGAARYAGYRRGYWRGRAWGWGAAAGAAALAAPYYSYGANCPLVRRSVLVNGVYRVRWVRACNY